MVRNLAILKRCLLLMLVCVAIGCTSLSKPKLGELFSTGSKIKESKYPPPAHIVAIWTPATLDTIGKPSIRGFGGRLFFYNNDNQAVPVEGQLVVYGYNDTGKAMPSKTPDKRFAFKPDQLASHFSPGTIGASYSIWIPWDQVGGTTTEVSLIPVFTAASGQVIIGQTSKNLLPGREPEPVATTLRALPVPQNDGPVQQASYLSPAGPVIGPQSSQPGAVLQPHQQLKEVSIPVPQTLAQRMATSRPFEAMARPNPNHMEIAQARPNPSSVEAAQPPSEITAHSMGAGGEPKTPVRTAMGGLPRPWSPPDPRLTRFSRPIRQVPIGQSPQPVRDPNQWQPAPAESPVGPPLLPQSAPAQLMPAASSAGASIAP